jgi:5'-nucleotidase (lipoprotein e(P4) family)
VKKILALVAAASLAGCATVPAPAGDPRPGAVPGAMQYLYGSAEAAALSEQAYNALVDNVRVRVAGRRPAESAILLPNSAGTPTPAPCGDKPYAAVFDMDETAILNLGYEYNDAVTGAPFDAARWTRWEASGADKIAAAPGAASAFASLRAMGVTPIINSNRNAASAGPTAEALANVGLGAFRHGETLFLKGDVNDKSAKDGRRRAIAARWCVLALGGDQIGDFTDALDGTAAARRAAASSPAYAGRWGRSWFILPNPVYGTGLGSNWDDTFPAGKRWTDMQGAK